MPEATLELSHAELTFVPGTVAVGSARRVTVEVDGEQRQFLARLEFVDVEGCDCISFFYREENADERDVFGREGYIVKPSRLAPENSMEWMVRNIHPNTSRRFWSAPQNEYALAVNWAGWINIAWDGQDRYVNNLTFRCAVPWTQNKAGDYPRDEFERFCHQLREAPNSALNRALRWKDLSFEERDDLAFACQVGDWNGLRHLFSLAQIVVTHQCGHFPPLHRNRSYWVFDKSEQSKRIQQTQAFQHAERFRNAICQIVQPSFWIEEPNYVIKWRHNPFRQYYSCEVRCGTPSHHEVLEAQLQLREFLRPHLPADEIEALFMPETSL